MARWYGTLMIGGLLTALVPVPKAHAADGRIVFSGAVVESTCAMNETVLAALLAHRMQATDAPRDEACSRQAPGVQPGALNTLVVSNISARQSEADQLLGYFTGYLRSQGSAQARLVTQTFE